MPVQATLRGPFLCGTWQCPGQPADDLQDFPAYLLPPQLVLYRIHREGLDPAWFCSDAECRFDLEKPKGTCYLALEPAGSFIEVFREMRSIAQSELRTRGNARCCDK